MKHEPDSERNKVTRFRQLVILGCLIVGCVFTLRATIPHASATSDVRTELAAEISPAVRSTAESPRLVTRNIEDIKLGQRVVGRNPLREETQPPSDINPVTWRAVRLSMFKGGVKYDLAFLRPLSWLESNSAKVGHSIHLEMHEMGLNGPAKVVAIDPCPEIEPDDGTGRNVVTGTMAHPGPNILYLNITGLDEPLGVTDTHPIWSETRHEFVVVGKLEVGEQFKTLTGETATLTKITPHRGPPEMVFNLEVDGQHVYSVAGNGLLVHNTCPLPPDAAFGLAPHVDDFADSLASAGTRIDRPPVFASLADETDVLESGLRHAMERSNHNHFTFAGFEQAEFDRWVNAGRPGPAAGHVTNWEAHTLFSEFPDKTTFYGASGSDFIPFPF